MNTTYLPKLATRVIGMPLMIERPKLETILSVIGGRVGLETHPAVFDGQQQKPNNGLVVTPNGIAIVPIHGTLVKRAGAVDAMSGLTSYAVVEEMILDAATNPSVKAILLDIDSPGGEVGGVFDLATTLKSIGASMPVWAYADDAFSAAYLLASTASKVYLSQTAGVGSIGVIAVHVDETAADMQSGLKYTTVFAGERKSDFSSHEPLSNEAKDRLQDEVDRLHGMFVGMVAENRQMLSESITKTQAMTYFGEHGVQSGLADQIGTFKDAIIGLSDFIQPKINQIVVKKGVSMSEVEQKEPVENDNRTILELCQLAGRPELAGDFIVNGQSASEVRQELLEMRAMSSKQEIQSHVLRHEGANASEDPMKSPIVLACKQRAMK